MPGLFYAAREPAEWQAGALANNALSLKIAWLDGDIIFNSPEWSDSASSMLDRFPIVQAFKQVRYLSARWKHGDVRTDGVEFIRPSAAFTTRIGRSRLRGLNSFAIRIRMFECAKSAFAQKPKSSRN